MPYQRNDQLPAAIKTRLPTPAQDIYRSAFNSAWVQYDRPQAHRGDSTRQQLAQKVAWAAVKHRFEVVGDHWRPKPH